ncbi:MAG: hypothetical protein B7X39_00010 [Lysobacterales bacterium 14-68-21]|nr:MAG: hypothetical protein B7X45_03360 [Xanthomonadales bacterium 15-68-25]OZB68281.1 MAG: hypothetical protein B7X39_00010 [Xanthomonadales bacterium 14-68-21]
MYAQGSMAIGATIASCRQNDEFDIDALAELSLSSNTPPRVVLDLLYEAVRGEPGSRYYSMTERCTRCVQVRYGDDMHVDITPTILRPEQPEREGFIFHANSEKPTGDDKRIVANPFGFAEWFKTRTPADAVFALDFAELSREHDRILLRKAADTEPVPEPVEAYKKSMALISLQLIKRWRNIRYDARPGRMPPSVLLAKLVADNANRTSSLYQELLHQAKQLKVFFEVAQIAGRLVHVQNPVCPSDVFSDRWPEDLWAQRVFISDLHDLVTKLEKLANCNALEAKQVCADLFGESPAVDALNKVADRYGSAISGGQAYHDRRTGSIQARASGIIATASAPLSSARTTGHRFYGGRVEDI